jgi:hypothetical protein
MTFLPVVERELRVAARRRQTYWTRSLAVLLTIGLCAWIWVVVTEGQPEHERGPVLFEFTYGLAYLYCLVAGIGITADCLSEEKREGTLGLLFLTDLKGYDVVLGKLAATSLNAFYRLLSIFPILAIPLLMGGLTFAEVERAALVLSNTLFLSLSAGMLGSSLSTQERRARGTAVLLLLVLATAPPLVGWVADLASHISGWTVARLMLSPVAPVFLALDKPYKLQSQYFWSVTLATNIAAWLLLAGSSFLIRRGWQDRPAAGGRAAWQERWRAWQFGHGDSRAAWRRRLLDANPVFWLTSRDRLRFVSVMAVLGGFGLVWLWLYWKYRSAMADTTVYFCIAYFLHTVIKIWFASDASRLFAEDRRTGALELVLSTSLTIDEILVGQALALKRQFGAAVSIILGADLLMLVFGMRDRLLDSFDDWLLLFLGIMIMFVVDLYTLGWVGLWLGLVSKKASRASAGNISRVLVIPWAVFLLGVSIMATLQWQTFDSETGLMSAGFVLAMLNDAILLNWARTNLRNRFRPAATQRFESRPSTDSDVGESEVGQPSAPVPAPQ